MHPTVNQNAKMPAGPVDCFWQRACFLEVEKMPDEKMYDMDFRPKTYWVYGEREQQMKATVLGDLRRQTAQEMLDGDRPYDPWYFEESITDEEKTIWTRVHPKFMGGEFLP